MFTRKKMIPFLIFVFLITFLLVIVIKSKKNQNLEFKPELLSNIDKKENTNIETSLSSFQDLNLKGKSLQLLESLYIINDTKNLDILSSRIKFVLQIYPDLKFGSKYSIYDDMVFKAVEKYKLMYYDRNVHEFQLKLLIKPNDKELNKFISESIFSCYSKYVEFQLNEISKLKRESSIDKRKDDLIKKGYEAKYIYKIYNLDPLNYLEKIEKLREQFYKQH